MLEAVLDTIATIASMNSFAKYYVTFMPGLKKIISMISGDTASEGNGSFQNNRNNGLSVIVSKISSRAIPSRLQINNVIFDNFVDKDDGG